ncbi:MAG: FecR domain-containing protein [Myxococcales bacterium]|nr:FecR domain-containing protein [Myxococcales bacterium]
MSDNADDDARLKDRGLDVDAWEAEAPPRDFTESVMRAVMAERADGAADAESAEARAEEPRTPARVTARRKWFAGGMTAIAAAAAVTLVVTRPPSSGEAVAQGRTEVRIGTRAIAVLEPGARVTWSGDDVVQTTGDVFYRVEPGARFRVHTPAGDAEVLGTCFAVKVRGASNEDRDMKWMQKRDVKAGAMGAAMSALAFVAVYEGKVAVSHAGQRAELRAGESATSGPGGVRRASEEEAAAAASALTGAPDGPTDPTAAANQNLVTQVRAYKDELSKIQTQKTELEQKLQQTEARLASSQGGDGGPAKHDFDLSPEDWAELAKNRTVKYRVPCTDQKNWTLSQDKLDKLGLAPADAAPIRDAYERSEKRTWAEVRPLCVAALGSADAVDKLGLNTCTHLILDLSHKNDQAGTREQMSAVGEIRAGIRPPPGPDDKVGPVLKLFLALTASNKAFEADLARNFGPEEAHRLAYSDEMCMESSTFGRGGKR